MQCQAIRDSYDMLWTHQRSIGGGGQCTREATYTDGKRFYCTQHAQQGATVAHKRSRKIRDGLQPIKVAAYVVKHRGEEVRRFADKVEAQKYMRRKRTYTEVNGNHHWSIETV